MVIYGGRIHRAQRALPIVIDLDPQEDATFEVDESLYEPGPPMKRFPGAVCSNPTTPVRQRITASAPGSSKLASGKVLFSPRAKQTSLDKFVKSSTSSPQKHKRLKRQSSMTGFLSISVNNGPSNLSSSSNGRPKEPKVSKPSLALTTSSSPRSGAPVPEEFVFVSPIDQDQQLAIAASLKDQAAYTQPGTLSETGSSSSKRMQFSIPRWSGYSWTDGQQLAGPSGTQIINTEAASLSPSRLHPSRSEPSKVRPLIDIPASAVKQPDEDNNDLFWPGGSQPSSGVETPLARSPLKRSFSTMNQGVDMSSSRPVKQRSLSSSPDPLQTQLCSPATQLLHSASETPRKLVSTSRPASCKVTPTSHVINKPLVSKSPSKASMATSKVREDSDLEDYEPYFDDVKELWDLENMRNARAYDHAKEPMSVQRVEPVPKLIQNDERTNLRLSLVSGSSKKTGQPALVPRRPYLSIQARRFLRNAGNWDGFKMFGSYTHLLSQFESC